MFFNVRLEDKWTIWIKSGQCPGCAKNHLIGPLRSLAAGLMFCTLGGGTLMETSKRSQLWLLKFQDARRRIFHRSFVEHINPPLRTKPHPGMKFIQNVTWNGWCEFIQGVKFTVFSTAWSLYLWRQILNTLQHIYAALVSMCPSQRLLIFFPGRNNSVKRRLRQQRNETWNQGHRSLHAKPADAY